MKRPLLFGLCLLLATGCIGLGVWQLGRLSSRRMANRSALAERDLPLLELGRAGQSLPANRRVRATGAPDESHEFLLRGRVVQGVPAIMVVTPLRPDEGDTALLVNRGYVPSPDAVDPGSATWSEAGRRQFTGVLLPFPDQHDGTPLVHRDRETWQRLDLSAMRARVPYPLAPVYLVAEPDSGTVDHTVRGGVYPFRAEPPPLDEGPHLMYAVQWFGIAAAVLAFAILFVWRKAERPAPAP